MQPEVVRDSVELKKSASISKLDNFLNAQRNSLQRLRDDVERLEDLKSQALNQPSDVFRAVMDGSYKTYLKHSEAIQELEATVPDLDWSFFTPIASAAKISPSGSSTRADNLRSEMFKFNQSFATLPKLPEDLLDNTENNSKKRKRIEPAPRSRESFASSAHSGGLRLPSARAISDDSTKSPQFTSIPRLLEVDLHSASAASPSSDIHRLGSSTPLESDLQPPVGDTRQKRTWATKGLPTSSAALSNTPSRLGSHMSEVDSSTIDQRSPISPAIQKHSSEPPTIEEELPGTFKKNWTLEEQHTLERLLTEIPSSVKFRQASGYHYQINHLIEGSFRWVKISEAMGGTRTPRQVASRVQKYYEKMKKLGVAIDSTEMSGGGRGGSKATEGLETPIRKSNTSRQNTRGMPKTGPQYTKSGRRR